MQKYMWLLSYADKKCVVTKPIDENGGGGIFELKSEYKIA